MEENGQVTAAHEVAPVIEGLVLTLELNDKERALILTLLSRVQVGLGANAGESAEAILNLQVAAGLQAKLQLSAAGSDT